MRIKTTFLKNTALCLIAAAAFSASFIACTENSTAPAVANGNSPGGTAATTQSIDVKGQMAFDGGLKLLQSAEQEMAQSATALQAGTPRDAALEAKVSHSEDVRQRHHAELMKHEGVIGTGVGLEADGTTSLMVFAKHANPANVASTIEDQKVHVEVVGDIKPYSGVYTSSYRPVPCGVSIGNDKENAAGTLGCAVNIGGYAYMLSCNHVLARQNAALIGEVIGQPGPYDAGGYVTPQVAVLSSFAPISFTSSNSFDAALAAYTTSGYASMVSGYLPSHIAMAPQVGMYVKKTGRTTGLTHGQIAAINVTIQVSYEQGTATFTNQIYIPGSFIQAGDSGSLLVTENGNNPVGLCFAGSSSAGFANPILPILSYWNATVIGS